MKSLFRLIVLVLVVAGWGLAALSLHVVRAQGDRIVVMPKQRLGLVDTYVDARAWTIEDVAEHADLVQRIIQSDKTDAFKYVVANPDSDVARQLEEALKAAPPSTRPDELQRAKTTFNNAKDRAAKTAGTWFNLGHKSK